VAVLNTSYSDALRTGVITVRVEANVKGRLMNKTIYQEQLIAVVTVKF